MSESTTHKQAKSKAAGKREKPRCPCLAGADLMQQMVESPQKLKGSKNLSV